MKIFSSLRYRGITTAVLATATAIFVTLLFSASASATQFRAGFHYTDYGTPLTAQPVVTEYISVFCPACNHLNGYKQEIIDSMPAGIPKRRVHVDFIRGTDMEGLIGIARLIALNEIYGDQMVSDPVDDVFEVIHQHRARINNTVIDQIVDMHNELNPDFNVRAAFESADVDQLALMSTRNQQQMQQAGAVTSVPTLMVNGRYQINLQNLNPNTMFEEITAIITFLTNKDYR